MSEAIIRKDLTVLGRDSLLRALLAVTIVLVVVSVFTGLQRERVFVKEKTAALETDRSVWMNQGDRNPHSAAHFSRYAFRPASPIALLDPGTGDFAGLAIWMEAHYQDPAAFRRAEDGGELSRYVQLTPAFLVLTVAPLLVFVMLFGSIAGEREDRTLRQLLASGVDAGRFFRGKLFAGLRLTLGGFTAVFLPVAVLAALLTPADLTGDAIVRLFVMYLLFAAYLVVFVALAIGVSAIFRTRQSAFLALTAVWTMMAIVVPRFGSDIATSVHPQPDARDATVQLRAASDVYYRDTEMREQIEKDVLAEYGVATIEELPIDYGAYVLQFSEEMSEPLFDEFYNGLDARYAKQEAVVRTLSLFTPSIAAANLSRGVAGTDRIHQREFSKAAEAHRREMVQLLNEDYMYNADGAGYAYTAGTDLWAQFEDLDHQVPALGSIGRAYAIDALFMLVWLVAAIGFAYWSVRRAVTGEEAA
ncbi:MAG: DUF3526 domain-containing protein [Woeseiaceae bacterium]|nr:DUF3526 domain-containing protein [Woeseiaceae bacterium]